MPTCPGCGGDHDAASLVRHEHDAIVIVHCPDCNCTMGTYNSHGRRR